MYMYCYKTLLQQQHADNSCSAALEVHYLHTLGMQNHTHTDLLPSIFQQGTCIKFNVRTMYLYTIHAKLLHVLWGLQQLQSQCFGGLMIHEPLYTTSVAWNIQTTNGKPASRGAMLILIVCSNPKTRNNRHDTRMCKWVFEKLLYILHVCTRMYDIICMHQNIAHAYVCITCTMYIHEEPQLP